MSTVSAPGFTRTVESLGLKGKLNGTTVTETPVENGVSAPNGKPNPGVWAAVSRYLPPRNESYDHWWNLSGPHLATMLAEAGYTVDEQYEGMIFHYHHVVPRMGSLPPPSGNPKYKSLLTVDGTPIEYSWKWNTETGAPDVRYTMEPIGQFTGTVMDPLNQAATKELLYGLSLIMPTLELSWFNHFAAQFFDTDKEAYYNEPNAHLTTTFSLAFEFLPKGLTLKAYYAPKKLGQVGPMSLDGYESAVRGLAAENTNLDKTVAFLRNDAEGKTCTPFMLAIDLIKPSASRVKLYVQTPHTSFDSVRHIMTMGGAITGVDNALEELRLLINAATGVDPNYPSDAQIPLPEDYNPSAADNFKDLPILLSGYLYYFDVAPGSTVPDIKFYIPIRRYGKDDATIAKGLVEWMEKRGRGKYGDNYMRILQTLCEHRPLEAGVGVQTYISCVFQKGKLSVTTYMGPEAYHPNRLAKLH